VASGECARGCGVTRPHGGALRRPGLQDTEQGEIAASSGARQWQRLAGAAWARWQVGCSVAVQWVLHAHWGLAEAGGERGLLWGGRAAIFLSLLLSCRGGGVGTGDGVLGCPGEREAALWQLAAGREPGEAPWWLLPARCSTKCLWPLSKFLKICNLQI
jgi:hypothetical protein